MDSLKPDAEDVDQFKARASLVKKRNSTQNLPNNTAKLSDDDIAASPKVNGAKYSIFNWGLFVVFLISLGFAGYTYYQQTARILVLESDLQNDRNFIRQSKLLMARLEGRLTETGSEIQQSGSEVQKKLKFLDSELSFLGSEVRKLWGVSWDRNKKAIAANKTGLAKIAKELENTQKAIDEQARLVSGLDTQYKAIEENGNKQFGLMATNIKALDAKWVEANAKIIVSSQKLNALESDYKKVLAQVRQLEEMIVPLVAEVGKGKNLQQMVLSNAETIRSINASRVQLNARLVSLTAQLNSLEKKVSGKEVGGNTNKNDIKEITKKAQVSGRSESQVRRVKVP